MFRVKGGRRGTIGDNSHTHLPKKFSILYLDLRKVKRIKVLAEAAVAWRIRCAESTFPESFSFIIQPFRRSCLYKI